MTKIELANIRQSLLESLKSINKDKGITIHEQSSHSDQCDIAFESLERELSSKLAEIGLAEAAKIQYAIWQIDHGRYGICENCEEKVPPGRMKALPYSTLCVNCQKLDEEGDICSAELQKKWRNIDMAIDDYTNIQIVKK